MKTFVRKNSGRMEILPAILYSYEKGFAHAGRNAEKRGVNEKSFDGYEVPQKILFITEDFTVANSMLTQTMKLKRAIVLAKYKDQLLALY